LIGSIVLPANTVADVKLSGLFAGHLTLKFRSNVSAPTPSATYFASSLTAPSFDVPLMYEVAMVRK
jgi:hypothetical protein